MIDSHVGPEPATVDRRTLRQFAVLCLVIFGGLAGWRWSTGGADAAVWTFGVLAVGLGAAGLVRPDALRGVYVGAVIATSPIGWLMSRLVLGVVFFGVITPLGAAFRLGGRDVLHRTRHARETYWSSRRPVTDVRAYFRQS